MTLMLHGQCSDLTQRPYYLLSLEELADIYSRFAPEEKAYAERDIWAGPEDGKMAEAEIVRNFQLALSYLGEEDCTGYLLGRRIALSLVSLSSRYCPYRGCQGGASEPDGMCLSHQKDYARIRYAGEIAAARGFKSEDVFRGARHVLQGDFGEERAAEMMNGMKGFSLPAHA